MPMPISQHPVSLSLLLATFAVPCLAQCTNPWLAENTATGLNGEVWAVHRWDRDGAGPLPELWVFAGEFTVAGTIAANRIVTYDPTTRTWAALGSGVNGIVHAMVTLPNGNLVVGGEFTTAGGIPTNRIATWNGSSWAALGPGFDDTVWALTVRPSGLLVAGGSFTVPGASTRAIAQWNGSTWSAVGGSFSFFGPGGVQAFATLPNGDLLATGGMLQLTTSGPYQWVVRWNGTSWAPFGTAGMSQPMFATNYDLLVRANGDVVLCGDQVHAIYGGLSGSGKVAIWNGTAWTITSTPSSTSPYRLCELTNGDLVAGGPFGWPVSRWTGTSWVPLDSLGGQDGTVRALRSLAGGELLVAGSVRSGPDVYGAARWNGTSWLPLGDGGWIGDTPRITARPDGSFVVALFRSPVSHLGLRSAGQWTPLGTAGQVLALATLPNGDVVAGGRFTAIGGVAANRIARWNGVAWTPLGPGIGAGSSDQVSAIAIAPNGDVIVAGQFTTPGNAIARWNGTSWSHVGSAFTGTIGALAVLPNGDVIAGGDLGGVGPMAHVARWNGSAWQAMAAGLDQRVFDLAVRPDGSVAACGLFTLPGGPLGTTQPGVAIWSPASGTWSGIGIMNGGLLSSLLTAANGDLVIGGGFTQYNNQPLQGLARWNGTTWSGLGPGATFAQDLTLAPDGDIGVVGVGSGFLPPGGIQAAGVARLSTTCPATVVPLGAGCTGAGGSPVLTATTLPWLGATFRSRATGLPANSFAIEVLGYTSVAVPLAAILPQGVAGCMLTTAPDLLLLHLPNAGTVDMALPLAPSIAFAGFVLHQQVVALSLGPTFDIVALTSSNSLQLTEGWF